MEIKSINIDGGNLQVCAPRDPYQIAVYAQRFAIDSGRFEIVDNIDVRKFLLYDAAVAAAATGVSFTGAINVSELIGTLYHIVILDAMSNGKIGDLEGSPYCGISCAEYRQNGGTVWCDKAEYGVRAYVSEDPVIVDGGSYRGQFFDDTWISSSESYRSISPSSSKTATLLKCVSYAVEGAKKYDKITKNWNGILPPYYNTGSLYADGDGKLYFWVPSDWDISGGMTSATQVTVQFDTCGGSLPGSSSRKVDSGASVGRLPTPVRAGYAFAGW